MSSNMTPGAALKRAVLSRTTLANATAGSLSAVAAMTLLYPLEKARVVIQAGGGSGSMIHAILSIYRDTGLQGLYGGLSSMLVSLSISNFVYFYWNSMLKSLAQSLRPQLERNEELKAGWALLIAFIAGCVNVTLTTPLWVATTRMALQRGGGGAAASTTGHEGKYRSLSHALATIYEEEGSQGLFAGLGPSLVLVTNPTIQCTNEIRARPHLLHTRSCMY
jgi:adenine nucleotide transporter 17